MIVKDLITIFVKYNFGFIKYFIIFVFNLYP